MNKLNIAILVAGGKGKRFGLPLPKQYYKINNKPIWYYTLKKFVKTKIFGSYIVVVSDEFKEIMKQEILEYFPDIDFHVVVGGKERYNSVLNGLEFLQKRYKSSLNDLVVSIHDAVRPLVSIEDIKETVKIARQKGNAILCSKSEDTLRMLDEDGNYSIINRDNVIRIQTPQSIQFEILYNSINELLKNGFSGTDESSFLEKNGEKLNFIFGDNRNIKLTTQDNIDYFNYILIKGE